jgi:YVTN family beta-propeller protein
MKINVRLFNKSQLVLVIALGLISILTSCKKDDNDSGSPLQGTFNKSSGLYIASQGTFQSANSSVSYFNPSTGEIIDDVFAKVNGHTPGDILQSMKRIGNSLYLVVNNSGRILVCNPNTMKVTDTISGFTSPRYILPVDSGKAYVSDLYANEISIINPDNNSVTSTIPLGATSEQMVSVLGKIYVTSYNSDYLYVINLNSNQLNDSIHISKGGVSICADINNKLWVLCQGDYAGAYNGALYRIDPSSKSIEQTSNFNPFETPSCLCMNNAKNQLYFINTHVYKMSINDNSLPSTSFVQSNSNTFYGIGIDPSNNDVYVSDAIDFVQNGKVYRYTSSGSLLNTISAGIAPGDFLFF